MKKSENKSYRGITLKVNPTKEQKDLMWKHVNHSRFIYNYMLERYWEALDNDKYIDYKDMLSLLKEMKNNKDYDFLNEISRKTLVGKIDDLRETLIKYHNNEIRKPKFKSKKREPKRFPIRYDRMHFNKEKHVKVEKIGYLKISNGTYKNNKSVLENESIKPLNPKCYYDGKYWYVSFSIEVDNQYKKEKDTTNEVIGIDLGSGKKHVICSNRKIYGNIIYSTKMKRLEKKLADLQKKVSNKYDKNYTKTNNILKLENKISKIYRKMSNIRKNHIHSITKDIVEQYPQEIIVEDIRVRDLIKDRGYTAQKRKQIQFSNFYMIRQQLQYKCEDRGIKFTVADTYYPSSQICSKCEERKRNSLKLQLGDKIFKCNTCGYEEDRDINASINLKNYHNSQWLKEQNQ